MEEDWVVLCHRLLFQSIKEEEWTEMHETLKEVTRRIGVKKDGQRIAGLGRLAWRNLWKESFLSQDGTRAGLQEKFGTARKPLEHLERGQLALRKCLVYRLDRVEDAWRS